MNELTNLFKHALSLIFIGSLSLGASAEACPTADSLGLSAQQLSQLQQILHNGNFDNPGVQQQVLGVFTPAQQSQLLQYDQQCRAENGDRANRGHHHHRDARGYANSSANTSPWYQNGMTQGYNQSYNNSSYINGMPYINSGSYTPNMGYNQTYNSGYYPANSTAVPYYNPGYNNDFGVQLGMGVLNSLLNSGLLNNLFSGGYR